MLDPQVINVATYRLFTSDGAETEARDLNVLAVVVLTPDVTFTKGKNNTWNLNK